MNPRRAIPIVALAALLGPLSAFAQNPTVSIDSVCQEHAVQPGQRACLPVLLDGAAQPVAGVQFWVSYPTGFSIPADGLVEGPVLGNGETVSLSDHPSDRKAQVIVAPKFAPVVPVLTDGHLVSLCFDVEAGVADGCYDLEFLAGGLRVSDTDGSIIPSDAPGDGSITVGPIDACADVDCDDGDACTIDHCVDGQCVSTPDPGACPSEGTTLDVGTGRCSTGASATVPLSISDVGPDGMSVAQWTLDYDPSVLSFREASAGPACAAAGAKADCLPTGSGSIRCQCYVDDLQGSNASLGEGEAVRVTFDCADHAAEGSYPVTSECTASTNAFPPTEVAPLTCSPGAVEVVACRLSGDLDGNCQLDVVELQSCLACSFGQAPAEGCQETNRCDGDCDAVELRYCILASYDMLPCDQFPVCSDPLLARDVAARETRVDLSCDAGASDMVEVEISLDPADAGVAITRNDLSYDPTVLAFDRTSVRTGPACEAGGGRAECFPVGKNTVRCQCYSQSGFGGEMAHGELMSLRFEKIACTDRVQIRNVPSGATTDLPPVEIKPIVGDSCDVPCNAASPRVCYKAKRSKEMGRVDPRPAGVSDEFGAAHLNVKKPSGVCTAADLGAGPHGLLPLDSRSILIDYVAPAAKGEAKFEKRRLKVADDLGELILDLTAPQRLLVEAGRSASGFRCYKAKVAKARRGDPPLPSFEPTSVRAVDAFGNHGEYQLKKVSRFCTEASYGPASGAPDGEPKQLVCYKAAPARGQKLDGPGIRATSPLGGEILDVSKPGEICLPARGPDGSGA